MSSTKNNLNLAELLELQKRLVEYIGSFPGVAVAFSGGVDSTLVAKAAFLALGDKSIAIMAFSPSLASGELERGRKTAGSIGIELEILKTREFEIEAYQENSTNRCYFCKNELYHQIQIANAKYNFDVILNGANADDAGDFRPGMKAAKEHGVRSPLLELGINKIQVREMAKLWGLEVWDKPASPCLASRIAYGIEVTPLRLKRVDQAEFFLKQVLSTDDLRVRDLGNDTARIEVPSTLLENFENQNLKEQIVIELKSLGFSIIELNLEGLRSGILNENREVKTRRLS